MKESHSKINYNFIFLGSVYFHLTNLFKLANSVKTVIKGTMSGGRVYDKILDNDYVQVKFISHDSVIAKILTSEEIEELRKDLGMI